MLDVPEGVKLNYHLSHCLILANKKFCRIIKINCRGDGGREKTFSKPEIFEYPSGILGVKPIIELEFAKIL